MPAESPLDPREAHRAPVPLPAQITIAEGPPPEGEGAFRERPPSERGELTIVRRWYQRNLWVYVAFCIFWDGFLINWYADASSRDGPTAISILVMVFPIMHVGVGVFLTYSTIAGFFNRTTITVTDRDLTIRHAPLPWRGNRRIPAAEITQLYCEETISHGKGGAHRAYHLGAVLHDGKKIRLLASLLSPEQARFIEQRIEDRLGIVDAPVEGEYKG